MKYLNMISCNESNHSIKHFVLYRDIDFIVDTKPIMMPVVNPPRLIRFREYRRGFQTPHELSFMPATLGRSGYLTTDTAQTQ